MPMQTGQRVWKIFVVQNWSFSSGNGKLFQRFRVENNMVTICAGSLDFRTNHTRFSEETLSFILFILSKKSSLYIKIYNNKLVDRIEIKNKI